MPPLGPATGETPRPPRVLLVEDEFIVRLALAEALRETGATVLEANNAEEARRVLLKAGNIDLLVTDNQMPGPADGVELARWVEGSFPSIRIVIISGQPIPREGAAVADAILHKPIAMSEFVAETRQFLPTRH
jgi:CheY-like chemotaxis protein